MKVANAEHVLAPDKWYAASGGGVNYRMADIFRPDEDDGLQVFYVRYADSGATTRPHFHAVPQFQLIVSGQGRLGRHRVSPFVLHYADPFTSYGPIVDEGGLGYLTIRVQQDPGARYMPENRATLAADDREAMPRRHFTVPISPSAPDHAAVVSEDLVSGEDDGCGAFVLRLGPDSSSPVGDHRRSPSDAHRMIVVLDGAPTVNGETLSRLSFIHLHGDETPVVASSAHEGAVVLVLDFPSRLP